MSSVEQAMRWTGIAAVVVYVGGYAAGLWTLEGLSRVWAAALAWHIVYVCVAFRAP